MNIVDFQKSCSKNGGVTRGASDSLKYSIDNLQYSILCGCLPIFLESIQNTLHDLFNPGF
jgi:hypothetical protein